MIVRTLCAAAALVVGSLAVSASAFAASFSHAGGFVCGELGNTNNRIVGGDHRTHFNIRNPNNRRVTVKLELALAFPAAEPAPNGASFTPGATTTLQSVRLGPREAVMIDCDELFEQLVNAAEPLDANFPPYISGILDVRAKRLLQVTRTQTAGPNGEDVSSISVTEIAGREIRDDDDNDDNDD